jgi:hypothetical protein
MNPDFPIYIPSKSRADIAKTPRYLDSIGVPYRLVIEEQQFKEYNKHFHKSKLIILDPTYKETFNPLMHLAEGQSTGSGPARNFLWDHSISEGWEYHWTMDDNIRYFARLHENKRTAVGDGTIFKAMEDFTTRYKNVAMSGPQYLMFAPSRSKYAPFVTGTRIYSCNLIKNDVPFRWRGRYNEDTILSLDMLKGGWTTIQFNAFLQNKMTTQFMKGGNMEAFYKEEGTKPKSQMLVDAHPDVARIVWRYNRWHHHVDYSEFRKIPLIKKDGLSLPEINPYNFKVIETDKSIAAYEKQNLTNTKENNV